jgi:hypothetical protein
MRVYGEVPRDAEQPGVDAAIAGAEPSNVAKCVLERQGGEVERVVIVPGASAKVSIYRDAVLLVYAAER